MSVFLDPRDEPKQYIEIDVPKTDGWEDPPAMVMQGMLTIASHYFPDAKKMCWDVRSISLPFDHVLYRIYPDKTADEKDDD